MLSSDQVWNVLRVYNDQLKEINVPVHRIDPMAERIFPPIDNAKKASGNHHLRNLITQYFKKNLPYR